MGSRNYLLFTVAMLAFPIHGVADVAVTQPEGVELIALPTTETTSETPIATIPTQSAAPILHSKRISKLMAESYRVKVPRAEDTRRGKRLIRNTTAPESTTDASEVTTDYASEVTVDLAPIVTADDVAEDISSTKIHEHDLPPVVDKSTAKATLEQNVSSKPNVSSEPKSERRRTTNPPPQPVVQNQKAHVSRISIPKTSKKSNASFDRLRHRNRPGARR